MLHNKFIAAALALLLVFAGIAFFVFNLSQIRGLLQSFAIKGGGQTVQITEIPASENSTSTSGIAQSIEIAQTQPTADLPAKLSPDTQAVSAPAVSEMPALAQNQVTGNGALTRAGVVALTNEQRQINLGAGFSLTENRQLDAAAASKVKDMFDGQYFEHMSPTGHNATYFAGAAGYEFILIGENLALGDYASDADLVKAWMASPGHRENILKAGYKDIGVAVGYGSYKGRKTWLAAQEFGVPKSACPEINSSLSAAIDANKKTLDQFFQQESRLLEKINEEKTRAQTLKTELNDLISTKSPEAAIKTKYSELGLAIEAANKDVNDYNAAIGKMKDSYSAYKSQIDQYNSQVKAYNACAAALQ